MGVEMTRSGPVQQPSMGPSSREAPGLWGSPHLGGSRVVEGSAMGWGEAEGGFSWTMVDAQECGLHSPCSDQRS